MYAEHIINRGHIHGTINDALEVLHIEKKKLNRIRRGQSWGIFLRLQGITTRTFEYE
jgi:hypothetical protein